MSTDDATSRFNFTTTSYVVLGLIALRGPSTPYDLKRAVSRSVAYFWPFPHSQLYSEPERLAGAGLLRRESEDGGRNRKTYHLTGEGRAALVGWIRTPAAADMPELRDTALLQMFFCELVEPEDLVRIARAQVEAHTARLALYRATAERFANDPVRKPRLIALDCGRRVEEAYIDYWTEIAANPPGKQG